MSLSKQISLFEIPSSSGREKIEFFVSSAAVSHDLVPASGLLTGLFWDDRPDSDGALSKDFTINISQMVLSFGKIEELLSRLNLWMINYEEFSVDLSADKYQKIAFTVAHVPELLCKKDKPALKFQFRKGSLSNLEVTYLVDQSCLQLTIDSLQFISKNKKGQYP